MERERKHRWDILIAVAAVVLFYAVLQLIGITCPIKYVTGISCAGCGMTRAWISLILHQDLTAACTYHPLFWMVVPAALVLLFKRKLNPKIYRVLLWVMISLALVVYIVRMISPTDQVVVFRPADGLIGRVVRMLIDQFSGR